MTAQVRIVTPEQLKLGYKVFHGADCIPNVTEHRYKVIRQRADGNYEVAEPSNSTVRCPQCGARLR